MASHFPDAAFLPTLLLALAPSHNKKMREGEQGAPFEGTATTYHRPRPLVRRHGASVQLDGTIGQLRHGGWVAYVRSSTVTTPAAAMTACLFGVLRRSQYRRCLVRAYATQMAPFQAFTFTSDVVDAREMLLPRLGKIKIIKIWTPLQASEV